MEGLVHFYTGDGKGKTTAAIGLAVRAAGAGRKVVFAQFMKGMDTSELAPLKTLGVQVVRKGTVTKFVPYMTEDERALCAAQQAETLAEARRLVPEDGVLVLDEIASAVTTGMVPAEDVLALERETRRHRSGDDRPPAAPGAAGQGGLHQRDALRPPSLRHQRRRRPQGHRVLTKRGVS